MPFQKGNRINLGRKHTREAKLKMSLAHLRKSFSEEHKKNISLNNGMRGKLPWNIGLKYGHYIEICCVCNKDKGKTYSKYCRSCSHKGIPRFDLRGKNHPFWKNGISKLNKTERQLAMLTLEYKLWRNTVLERDDWTCRICLKRGGDLEVDHIKPWALYPELRYAIDNGRVLCVNCHRLTDSWGFKSRREIQYATP